MKENVLTGYKKPSRSRPFDVIHGPSLFKSSRSIYSFIYLHCKEWFEKLMLFRKILIMGPAASPTSFPNPLHFNSSIPSRNLLSKSKSLAKEKGDKILLPYFRTKPFGQGTLSISYDQVKAQGGELKVHSEAGISIKFIIKLP
jgi:hypothetical protein